MRKNFGVRPFIYPEPVLIVAAYSSDGSVCAMNAAWGGIHEENELFLCLSPEHRTTKNILESKIFSVSIGTEDFVTPCDYLGIVSGNDVPDKIDKSGFTVSKAEMTGAPIINELPMAIECRLISYDDKHCELIAEIVNVCVDESVLNADGGIDPKKLRPLIYDGFNHDYYGFGNVFGKAFSEGKKLQR